VKLVVVAVGKIRDAPMRAVADDYFSRLSRYVAFEEREVKSGADLESGLPSGAVVIALEVHGEALTSEQLSKRVEQWSRRNKGVVAFLIGGADGIPAEISKRADARLSLSSLTLPHRLARVVLAEQLYRSMTLLRGEPYARE